MDMVTDSSFVVFMSNMPGRMLRVVAGIALALVGIYVASAGIARDILVGLGVIVFLAGALNVCLIAPIFGSPFMGKDVRKGDPLK
jgi:hypothetical protein